MALEPATLSQLLRPGFDTVIDVRSPAEYAEDHIPGAINLPAFSNEERARVGTIYKQQSPFLARKVGAAILARNVAGHIETALADRDGGWRPLVYCWRGGQRSGAFATILSQIGWRTETVAGGYKTYRRLVVSLLYERPFPAPVVLLDGNTGTAKTAVIGRLTDVGVQALDLEAMAGHRGSALGGQGDQPSQKMFESRLAQAVADLDPARPVVVEAESSRIGRLNLPPTLFGAMQGAPRVVLSAPVAARAAYLARAYADVLADRAAFAARLDRLIGLQGRAQVAEWQRLLDEGADKAVAADLIERHYDPAYARARRGGESAPVLARIEADSLDDAGIAALARSVAGTVRSLPDR